MELTFAQQLIVVLSISYQLIQSASVSSNARFIAIAPDNQDESVSNDNKIYIYKVQDNYVGSGLPTFALKKTWTTPYTVRVPMLVWNQEVGQLELAGDWRESPNMNYGFLNVSTGAWTAINNQAWDGRMSSAMVHTHEIGTIVLGGFFNSSMTLDSVVQLYSPKSWNGATVTLPPLSSNRSNLAAIYVGRRVYVAGGYCSEAAGSSVYSNALEVLDVSNVATASDAAQLKWVVMKPLQQKSMGLNLQFYQNTLFNFGGKYAPSLFTKDLEVYDLRSNTSKIFPDVFTIGRYLPASIISGSKLTVIGGEFQIYNQSSTLAVEQGSIADYGNYSFLNEAGTGLTEVTNMYTLSAEFTLAIGGDSSDGGSSAGFRLTAGYAISLLVIMISLIG